MLSNAWDVFLLFLIPIGGGIPAGVVLANQRGLTWPIMMVLYFCSDVVLAVVFDLLMIAFKRASLKGGFLGRFREALKFSVRKTTARFGLSPGPIALVMISFGVDPMTGRAATMMMGHGFVVGWLLAIAGDMIFFSVIMASTLWLNSVLGDGTWAAVIVMVAMFVVPTLIRRIREGIRRSSALL